jgi:hypothetical protein
MLGSIHGRNFFISPSVKKLAPVSTITLFLSLHAFIFLSLQTQNVLVKLSPCLITHHVVKAQAEVRGVLQLLNGNYMEVSDRSATKLAILASGKSRQYPSDSMLGGPHFSSEHGEIKLVSLRSIPSTFKTTAKSLYCLRYANTRH